MILLKNCLLLSILRHGDADRFMSLATAEGASGGTVFLAKGTASNSILRLLGLGDKTREVILTVVDEITAGKILDKATNHPKIEGVGALIKTDDENMEEKIEWKLITVIVNSGYADDIMDTARKVGASGGTITHARGTAPSDGSANFLGITVVPEKEMILILCKNEDSEKLINAISEMECLQAPGIGIIFTQNVKKFINLGKDKK